MSAAIVSVREPKIKAKKFSELKTYRRRTIYPELLERLKGSYTVEERTEKVQRNDGNTSQVYIQSSTTTIQLFEEFDHGKNNSNHMKRESKVLTEENEEEKGRQEKVQCGSNPENTTAYLDRGNGSCRKTGSVEELATQRSIVYSARVERKGEYSDDYQHQRPHHRSTFLPSTNPKRSSDSRSFIQRSRNADEKPSYSYVALIAMAILSSPSKKLLLADIYSYIEERFVYFRHQDQSWRNSIRHNLSLNDCFVKTKRSENGKGSYWTIHPDNLQDFARGDYRQCKPHRRVRNRSTCVDNYRHVSCYATPEFVTCPTMQTPPWLLMEERYKNATTCTCSTSQPPVHSVGGLHGHHSRYSAPLPWQPVTSAEMNCGSEITKVGWVTDKLRHYSPKSLGDAAAAYQDTLMEGIAPCVSSWQETLAKLQQQLTKKNLNE